MTGCHLPLSPGGLQYNHGDVCFSLLERQGGRQGRGGNGCVTQSLRVPLALGGKAHEGREGKGRFGRLGQKASA